MITTNLDSVSHPTQETLLHDEFFNELRIHEYSRLDDQRQIYLDYTGGNLYGTSQLRKHQELLSKYIFGNPHSTNPTSRHATQLVDQARAKVLEFFQADDYFCIFTQNASGALKIVGECFPFCEEGQLLLLADNHNSVNGIREYCKRNKGSFKYAKIQYENLKINPEDLNANLQAFPDKKYKLFAFPAQSNVSGIKHDLSWIQKAQDHGWDVLLDAAAFVPTNRLNLKEVTPDFVSVSFYKMFGYPTGIGCLLVRKSSFSRLEKRWFAGGTVSLASVLSPHHYLMNNHERFENGTIDYLNIPALSIGLEFLEEIGMPRINERIQSLIGYLFDHLKQLKHHTGHPIVKLFGPLDNQQVGGTAIMTFCNPDGGIIPFEEIEKLTNTLNISIRSGCFCNPGIDEVNNCLSTVELSEYFTSRDKGSYQDMIDFLHKMRGATRVSVGLATTKKDLDAYIHFVESLKDQTIEVS